MMTCGNCPVQHWQLLMLRAAQHCAGSGRRMATPTFWCACRICVHALGARSIMPASSPVVSEHRALVSRQDLNLKGLLSTRLPAFCPLLPLLLTLFLPPAPPAAAAYSHWTTAALLLRQLKRCLSHSAPLLSQHSPHKTGQEALRRVLVRSCGWTGGGDPMYTSALFHVVMWLFVCAMHIV